MACDELSEMIRTTEPVYVIPASELKGLLAQAASAAVDEFTRRNPARHHPRPFAVTRVDAAEMLGISAPTLRKLIIAGRLTPNDAGKIPMSQIDQMLA